MKLRKILLASSIVLVFLFLIVSSSLAYEGCTCVAVAKDASIDGSTMITHNDDSGVGDVRLWIIPAADWPEGSTKEIIVDGHSYGDFGRWPFANFPAKELYGTGFVVGEMPQVPHTYRYFHSRYSFANEKGVVMGETTCTPRGTEYADEIRKVMGEVEGKIDMWFCMDIALQRSATAREAVQVMGDLIEEYLWYGGMSPGSGECAVITDGNEVWIQEFYGLDLWCAVKLPDDQVFVSANRHRIRDVDFDDEENVMYAPNLIDFAVERGWYDPDSGEPFRPADIYGPKISTGSNAREWRVLSILAPSLNLQYDDTESPYSLYPFSVKPDKKVSVDDIFKITGDTFKGTKFDLTKGPGSGPYGDPIPSRPGGARSVNTKSTLYGQVSQVKGWLPEPIKAVTWLGHSAMDTSYLTPLNPNMEELPKCYTTGSRYEDYDRDSAWWISTRVMHLAEYCYSEAIKDIYAFREPKMEMLYHTVPLLQEHCAEIYKVDREKALSILHNFYYNSALAMHEEWKRLGDILQGKYFINNPKKAVPSYPDWWKELIQDEYGAQVTE